MGKSASRFGEQRTPKISGALALLFGLSAIVRAAGGTLSGVVRTWTLCWRPKLHRVRQHANVRARVVRTGCKLISSATCN